MVSSISKSCTLNGLYRLMRQLDFTRPWSWPDQGLVEIWWWSDWCVKRYSPLSVALSVQSDHHTATMFHLYGGPAKMLFPIVAKFYKRAIFFKRLEWIVKTDGISIIDWPMKALTVPSSGSVYGFVWRIAVTRQHKMVDFPSNSLINDIVYY